MISIARSANRDRAEIEALLEANDLPVIGLELALGTMVVALEDGGRLVGCAGFEPYPPAGLLRSVCVAPDLRGTGLGRRLVAETERLASGDGIGELFLLTESAAEWFSRLGYERARREAAPPDMAASPEFAIACPVSALVYRKSLRPA